jgi:hypothetical protein
MKFKILTFLVTLALGVLAWFPFKPAPHPQRHMLALGTHDSDSIPVDFHAFSCEVNGQPALMHIARDGDRLAGYYSVRNSETSIPIRGVVDDDSCVLLVEYAHADQTPTGWFRGEMRENPENFRLILSGSRSRSENGMDPGDFRFDEIRFPSNEPLK